MRSFPPLIAALWALAACQNTSGPADPPPRGDTPRQQPAAVAAEAVPEAARTGALAPEASGADDGAVAAVTAAIAAGDLAGAHELLGPLVVEEKLAEARELLASGDPRDALLPLDDALRLAPENADSWSLRGTAAFRTAASDSQAGFFYQEALDNFEEALRTGPRDAEVLLGASRAARMSFEAAKALDYAREAMEQLAGIDPRPTFEVEPERVLCEPAFDVYVERRNAGEPAAELFAEIEDNLQRLLGRAPEDAWAWSQLANLYQWDGRPEEAIASLERALELSPDDTGLHDRYIGLVRSAGGRDAVLEAYTRIEERRPGLALTSWYLGVETFEAAVDGLRAGEDRRDDFRRAEQLLQHCRELQPDYTTSCLGYEVMCHNGVGWCLLNADEPAAAEAAFVATEEVLEGGLQWQVEGRLLSGVMGLQFVADKYSQDPQDAVQLGHAAEIFAFLHGYLPDDPNFANNAGFFHRDAGVALDLQARIARDRASREEAEATALEREADQLEARAREHMEKSLVAYVDAARLAPEDVRIVNDTGLIMTYYTRRDPERAEEYLLRAVELGTRQVEESTLSEDEHEALLEAWGDAHQNLGVLYLTMKDDPQSAIEWFEKSVEIGPVPREMVTRYWIPAAQRALAGEAHPLREVLPFYWAEPRR